MCWILEAKSIFQHNAWDILKIWIMKLHHSTMCWTPHKRNMYLSMFMSFSGTCLYNGEFFYPANENKLLIWNAQSPVVLSYVIVFTILSACNLWMLDNVAVVTIIDRCRKHATQIQYKGTFLLMHVYRKCTMNSILCMLSVLILCEVVANGSSCQTGWKCLHLHNAVLEQIMGGRTYILNIFRAE